MSTPPIVCRSDCGRTYRGHGADVTAAQQEQQARAAGWRLGRLGDGTPDARCPTCSRPDPALLRLAEELTR